MQLGYINFSSEEQEQVREAIRQITQGAIDELGLGRIRDAFSDTMFPGLSTLHRKSKYFCLLPALYDQLSKSNIHNRNDIPRLLREYEINMTLSLLNGAAERDSNSTTENAKNADYNHTGITGSSLGKEGLRKGRFVKQTPTNIYYSALKYYGLVGEQTNVYDLIYRQSQLNPNPDKGHKIRKEKSAYARTLTNYDDTTESDNNEIVEGKKPDFFPFTGYDFSQEGSIGLKLRKDEAETLRKRIISKCKMSNGGKDILLSYLLCHDNIAIKEGFFEMKDAIDDFPEEQNDLKHIYHLACDFSLWAHLMNSVYRLAFYQSIENEERVHELRQHIQDGISKYSDSISAQRLKEILAKVQSIPDFSDSNGLCRFCEKAGELLEDYNHTEQELIRQVIRREKSIKKNHYKIGNTKYKNTNFAGNADYYSYRWNNIAYSMIKDIREALK